MVAFGLVRVRVGEHRHGLVERPPSAEVAADRCSVTGPGVRADFSVVAGFGDLPCDLLARNMMRGSKTAKFAGRDVLREDIAVQGRVTVQLTIPYKRRMMTARVRVEDATKADAALAVVAKMLAPTLE